MTTTSAACKGEGATHVVAHRASMLAEIPENSLAALTWAAAQGVNMVEVDLRPAKAGEPVVIHDASVHRTTNGKGRVSELTVGELSTLRLANGEPVPSFEAALSKAASLNLQLLLDMKDAEKFDLRALLARVERHFDLRDVVFGVRTSSVLQALLSLNPDVRTLGFVRSPDQIDTFVGLGVDAIRLWGHRVLSNPEHVAALQQQGIRVWSTTGPTAGKQLQRILNTGVNAVITDIPHEIIGRPCCC